MLHAQAAPCSDDNIPVFPLNSNFDSLALLNDYLYIADKEIPTGKYAPFTEPISWVAAAQYMARGNEQQKTMRFCIEVGPEATGDYLLYLHDLQQVTVRHQLLENGPWLTTHAGTLQPVEERPIYRGFLLEGTGYSTQVVVPLFAGTNTIYLQADYLVRKPFRPQLRLYEKQYWFTEVADRFFSNIGIHLLFVGAMLIMAIYHLLIFFQRRDAAFFWYAAYTLVVATMLLIESGLFQVYITPHFPRLNILYRTLLPHAIIGYVVYWLFLRSFVDLQKLFPRLDKILRWFLVGLVTAVLTTTAFFLSGLGGNYRELTLTRYLFPVIGLLFGVVYFFLILRAKKPLVNLFLAGSLVLLIGVLSNTLISLAVYLSLIEAFPFPHFMITEIAVTIELLIFALALGLRFQQSETKRQRAEETNQLKSRFFANVSHEFRTPLTVISGLAGQIKGNDKVVSIIKRNTDNLLELVGQLLDLAKVNAGQLATSTKTADILPYLNYLLESLYPLAIKKEIRLNFLAEEEALIMDYDAEKIRQIVFNLLSNAIKFTPSQGKIILHAQRKKTGLGDTLQLQVKDSGIGIPAEEIPFVFERFFQADTANRQTEQGAGVGLALVKELVEFYGGTVSVKSKIGEGSTFTVLLPIAETGKMVVEGHDQHTTDIPHTGPEFQENSISSDELVTKQPLPSPDQETLLIVDDNRDIITYLHQLLSSKYLILTATNGAEGIARATECIPDIIISDVMMPVMDGYTLTQKLKADERTSHIPVILLTAKAGQEDRVAGLRGGADAFLTKPFNQDELFIRLEQLVKLRRQLRERYTEQITSFTPLSEDSSPLEHPFLQKIIATVKPKLDDPGFDVGQLCQLVSLNSTQLNRKLKALTGKTANGFIRMLRLQQGKKLLQNPDFNISEVAWSVGFNDPNYFSRAFTTEFGLSPRAYRQQIDLSE